MNDTMKQYLEDSNEENNLEAIRLLKSEDFDITMSFYLPLPKTLPNSKRNAILWGSENHTSKRDLDNLIKFYLDCANEVLFPDDHLITKIEASKEFSNQPRTVLNIMPKECPISDIRTTQILSTFNKTELDQFILDASDIAMSMEMLQTCTTQQDLSSCKESIAIGLKEFATSHHDKLRKIANMFKPECKEKRKNKTVKFHMDNNDQ